MTEGKAVAERILKNEEEILVTLFGSESFSLPR